MNFRNATVRDSARSFEEIRVGLPIFIDEVPDCEVRGDNMFMRWRGAEIALPVVIGVQAMLLFEETLAKARLAKVDNGRVVRLSRRKK